MMNEENAPKTDGGERHNGTNMRRKRPKKVSGGWRGASEACFPGMEARRVCAGDRAMVPPLLEELAEIREGACPIHLEIRVAGVSWLWFAQIRLSHSG